MADSYADQSEELINFYTSDRYLNSGEKTDAAQNRCDPNCPEEYRKFNGRDCAHRVRCLILNGRTKELSRSQLGEFYTRAKQSNSMSQKFLIQMLNTYARMC